MSASEKLKAVKPFCSWTYEGIEDDGAFEDEDFRPLLPLIVAVTSALERVLAPWEKNTNPAVDEALAFARDALTALEEALS